jgi:hypothetical protein
MSEVPAWFQRKFEFTFPAEQYPNLCVGLRGTPARVEDMMWGVSRNVLTEKPAGKWSAQEHTGHLLDLESLWPARVDDFLGDDDTLTAADLTNRKTHEADHNSRAVAEILAKFRAARVRLVDSPEWAEVNRRDIQYLRTQNAWLQKHSDPTQEIGRLFAASHID